VGLMNQAPTETKPYNKKERKSSLSPLIMIAINNLFMKSLKVGLMNQAPTETKPYNKKERKSSLSPLIMI
jgi:hypothetical protein